MLSALVVFTSLALSSDVVEGGLKRNLYTHEVYSNPKVPIPLPVHYNLDIIPGLAKFPMSKELKEALDAHFMRKFQEKKRIRRANAGKNDEGAVLRDRHNHYRHPVPVVDTDLFFPTTPASGSKTTITPEDLNAATIFRILMTDAILRLKNRNYDDDDPESDMLYVNLLRKVLQDEINNFHSLLLIYKFDKSMKEHVGECGGRIYKFITYVSVKVHILCLFDSLWIDGNPYVIGDDYSVTPLEFVPMLQCDASECNTVAFVDSMFDYYDDSPWIPQKK